MYKYYAKNKVTYYRAGGKVSKVWRGLVYEVLLGGIIPAHKGNDVSFAWVLRQNGHERVVCINFCAM